MMADGRDMSGLFAAVVKNVVSKNVEASNFCKCIIAYDIITKSMHIHSLVNQLWFGDVGRTLGRTL